MVSSFGRLARRNEWQLTGGDTLDLIYFWDLGLEVRDQFSFWPLPRRIQKKP
jgi:hypothetical protein